MLRIHFTHEDLARTTIAAGPDPLWEILLSLHVLQHRSGELIFGTWRREARQQVGLSVRLLTELAPPHGYSPDFLTPPDSPTDITEAVDLVQSTPRRHLTTQLGRLAVRRRPTDWTKSLCATNRDAMERLGGTMMAYYERSIAPYWAMIAGRVTADRARRVRQLADRGVGDLLDALTPRTHWTSFALEIPDFHDAEVWLRGRGLTLQPSYFCWRTPTKLWDDDLPPVLVYPVEHRPGELSAAGAEGDARESLAALLGRTRARALEVTARACTTTDLARSCDLSLGTASHHATVLREAGLITTRRDGVMVRHEITPLGVDLLNGHGR